MFLALANLLHHKARSLLSALAVGLGVAMLVTMLGLSHGSLDEITRRMQAVDADLLVMPRDFSTILSSTPFGDKHVAIAASQPEVAKVAPVYLARVIINRAQAPEAKRSHDIHNLFGVRASDRDFFLPRSRGLDRLIAGRLFADDEGREQFLFDLLREYGSLEAAQAAADGPTRKRLASAFELVIDQRLADTGHIQVGDAVEAMGRRFTVVGVAPTGVTVRAFAPIATCRVINEEPRRSSLIFLKTAAGVDPVAAGKSLSPRIGASVMTIPEYGSLFTRDWAMVPQYTLITSIVVLTVAFLFVLVIMYTVVIQRTREIGILKSLGASRRYIVRVVLAESMLLSSLGTLAGLGMSVGAKVAIMHFKPLLTVDLNVQYIAAGVATGLLGGLLSGLYPALLAARQDPVTALSYE